MNLSLQMDVELVDGRCVIAAPWLSAPVDAKTFYSAYFMAVAQRPRGCK